MRNGKKNLYKKIGIYKYSIMEKINKQTFTLTYGNCAENHKSMEIIGKKLEYGLKKEDLEKAKKYFENLKYKCELIELHKIINITDEAYLLIVRNGVDAILGENKKDDLYLEQDKLEKDSKAYMYGRVVNKKARHNLCFSDYKQQADYENKKGTVVNFKDVKYTNIIRNKIYEILNNDIVKDLQCEGNYYYDVEKTYIGFHGDTEREIVIAVRLGADFPLYYQWYKDSKKVGELYECVLKHGDIYFMSEKAVGTDWKKSSKYTLRHAAGSKKMLNL